MCVPYTLSASSFSLFNPVLLKRTACVALCLRAHHFGGSACKCLTAPLPSAQRLNVQGRRAALIEASSAEWDEPPGGSGGHEKPRVIEVEGLMEEYLAYDSRDA